MLTGEHIRKALASVGAVGGQMRSFDELARGANEALARAPQGLTPAGAAAFLATMAQESAWFRTTTEYSAGKNRYSPFDGRTFEQITWRENYQAFVNWCKAQGYVSDANVFVNNPRSLSDYRWAWLGGVWYFEANGLWRYANSGNFLAVSQAVNGGMRKVGTSWTPSGWVTRKKAYDAFLSLGNALLPGGSTPPSASVLRRGMKSVAVERLQAGLLRVFPSYASPIKAGGGPVEDFGPATEKVVKEFQRRVGIPADGIVGPVTRAQLAKYGVTF